MKIFENIDMFGKSPSLIINSKTEHKTRFGGFVTCLLIIISLISACFFGQEIIFKTSPSVNLSTEFFKNPEKLIYEDNFEFIIGVQNSEKNMEINPRIYTVKANVFKTEVNDSGVFSRRDPISIVPCSNETLSPENIKMLYQYDLKNFYCLSYENKDELYLNEFFGHNQFRMIQIKLYECVNTTKDDNCESPDVIEDFLNLTTISIISLDNYIQTRDYNHPFAKGLKSTFFYASRNYFLSLTQYIHHIRVFSDDGLLFTTNREQRGFKLEEMVDYTIYQRDQDNFVSFSIQLNNIFDGYYRKYYKLQDFAAQCGGIYKCVSIVFFIVMIFYEETSYYLYLINNFFHIQTNSSNGDLNQEKTTCSAKFNLKSLNRPPSIRTNINEKPKDETKEETKEEKSSKKILELSFFDKLFCISLLAMKCRKKKDSKEKTYLKGTLVLDHYLDIIKVIKSIYDINMMKRFIFSEEQSKQYEALYLPILSEQFKPPYMRMVGSLNSNHPKIDNYVYSPNACIKKFKKESMKTFNKSNSVHCNEKSSSQLV